MLHINTQPHAELETFGDTEPSKGQHDLLLAHTPSRFFFSKLQQVARAVCQGLSDGGVCVCRRQRVLTGAEVEGTDAHNNVNSKISDWS